MMTMTQVQGSTYVLEGAGMIPLYRIDDNRCVLLDTGWLKEREEIEETLQHHGLTPVAILCSHAHIDHAASNRYFQETYGTTVAMTSPEAGMINHILNLKSYRLLVSPAIAHEEMGDMVHHVDVMIPPQDGTVHLAGVNFQVLFTPGHSCGHICTITPDNVCYTGDAIMSKELMSSKLPYGLAIQLAMDSRERLRGLTCDYFIMAHRGICAQADFDALIDANQALNLDRAARIKEVVTEPVDFSELCRRVCKALELRSNRPRQVLYYERNTRLFVEYLVDNGELVMSAKDGVVVFGLPEHFA